MSFSYNFGLTGRKVSLAVRLLDSYTGQPPQGAYVSLEGAIPLIKPDGYFVFTNLPDGPYKLIAGGDMFIEERLTLEGGINNIYLIPSPHYPLRSGAAYIKAENILKASRLFGAPAANTISLSKPYFPGGKIIETNCRDYDLEGRLLAFADGEDIIEWIVAGERIGNGKYALATEAHRSYGELTPLYPLSHGRTDENGRLFMPLWGIGKDVQEAAVYLENGSFYMSGKIMRVEG